MKKNRRKGVFVKVGESLSKKLLIKKKKDWREWEKPRKRMRRREKKRYPMAGDVM